MLNQSTGNNLSTKETIVMSQDCPKFLWSPVTCGNQRLKTYKNALHNDATLTTLPSFFLILYNYNKFIILVTVFWFLIVC